MRRWGGCPLPVAVPLHNFFVARFSAWRAPPGLALACPGLASSRASLVRSPGPRYAPLGVRQPSTACCLGAGRARRKNVVRVACASTSCMLSSSCSAVRTQSGRGACIRIHAGLNILYVRVSLYTVRNSTFRWTGRWLATSGCRCAVSWNHGTMWCRNGSR